MCTLRMGWGREAFGLRCRFQTRQPERRETAVSGAGILLLHTGFAENNQELSKFRPDVFQAAFWQGGLRFCKPLPVCGLAALSISRIIKFCVVQIHIPIDMVAIHSIKTFFRFSLLSSAVLLAACTTGSNAPQRPSSITLPQSGGAAHFPVYSHTSPAGNALPFGYTHAPAGSGASYLAVPFSALPQWNNQPFSGSLNAFLQSCTKLYSQAGWSHVCSKAAQTGKNDAAAKHFFEQNFTVWRVSGSGQLGGTVTGYYEPVLHGDTRRTSKSRFPIYGLPSDFISVSLPAHLRNSKSSVRIRQTGANTGSISSNGPYVANLAKFPISERSGSIKGRIVGNQFVPYFTRSEINRGALDRRAPILGYADDPVELFFLHIQGSGRIRTPDGRFIRVGFADKNEYPYVSIGKYMAERGYLPLSQASMQNIKSWIAAHPHKMAEVLGQNPSYVFFRQLPGDGGGPLGALGVPLSGGFSGAVDKRYITLGAPLFVATVHPDTRQGLNRLIVAQDTGSAIKGAVRVDYFWGYGDAAGQTAGRMKNTGYVWQLLPHGILPSYRP